MPIKNYTSKRKPVEMTTEQKRQELFNYFSKEHGISLLQTEMGEVVDLVIRLFGTDENALQLAYKAINKVKDKYPTDIFPQDNEYLDCKSAEMARITCDNIKRELDEMVSGNDR